MKDYGCDLSKNVTTTEDWLEQHKGHEVVRVEEQISIKIMRTYHCKTCDVRHLYDMETVS